MTDLTSRVAELATSIEKNLAEDEALAMATISSEDRVSMRRGTPPPRWVEDDWGVRSEDRYQVLRVRHTWAAERAHIVRNDPARALRRVKATRDLVAAIMAERHFSDSVEYYSCSQATDPLGYSTEPGSGCSDPDRAGHPCDCGRDARVGRLLTIIASEWEGGS